MSHLVINLVDELAICGMVLCKWMYPIKRYLSMLKEYVQNRLLLEDAWQKNTLLRKRWGCAQKTCRDSCTCNNVCGMT